MSYFKLLVNNVLLLGLLTVAVNKLLEKQNNSNQTVVISYDEDRITEVKLVQNHCGHYVATGKINAKSMTFYWIQGQARLVFLRK